MAFDSVPHDIAERKTIQAIQDRLLNTCNWGKSLLQGRVMHSKRQIHGLSAQNYQTLNSEQFKLTKHILPNSSRNSGGPEPNGRVHGTAAGPELFAVHRCPLGSNFVSWHDAANDLTAIAKALSAKNIVVSRKSGLTPAVSVKIGR
jgi:hypothetical protein